MKIQKIFVFAFALVLCLSVLPMLNTTQASTRSTALSYLGNRGLLLSVRGNCLMTRTRVENTMIVRTGTRLYLTFEPAVNPYIVPSDIFVDGNYVGTVGYAPHATLDIYPELSEGIHTVLGVNTLGSPSKLLSINYRDCRADDRPHRLP